MSVNLLGRSAQCRLLDGLVEQAASGAGAMAVISGDPGVGKTALLEHAAAGAPLRVERLDGFESESALPFAGLHRFLLPFDEDLAGLPERQLAALRVAFGEMDGPAPDRFLIGLATWSLVRTVAERAGLLVCIDDLQWLDQESIDVLIFVGRRVRSIRCAFVVAMRGDVSGLQGFYRIDLVGLDRADALDLLRRVRPGRIDPRIADRIVTATGGNPLALTDLGAELSSHQLVGGTMLPELIPIGTHLESHYLQRVRTYSPQTQLWLLVAAAEHTGAIDIVLAAADALGLAADAAGAAEDEGLISIESRIRFRHDLIRSAIYGGATATQRRTVHRALATVIGRHDDIDRRAWHLACACIGPDDDVAVELETAANRARDRGGYSARAAFLARAVELSRPGPRHLDRVLAAAEAAVVSGSATQAQTFLDIADGQLDTAVQRGRALMIRAGIQAQSGGPAAMANVSATCVEAAQLFEHTDADRARDALLYAFETALGAEWRLTTTTLDSLSELALRREYVKDRPELPCVLLTALGMLHTAPFEEAAPFAHRAIAVMDSDDVPDADILRCAVLAVAVTTAVWNDVARDRLLRRAITIARAGGALPALASLLWLHSITETVLGQLSAAESLLVEVEELKVMIGSAADRRVTYRNPEFIAWRATDNALARDDIRRCHDAADALGLGAAATLAQLALGNLLISETDYAEAYAVLAPICARRFVQISLRALPDLIEAAIRSGRQTAADAALAEFTQIAEAAQTPWRVDFWHDLRRCAAQPEPKSAIWMRSRI